LLISTKTENNHSDHFLHKLPESTDDSRICIGTTRPTLPSPLQYDSNNSEYF